MSSFQRKLNRDYDEIKIIDPMEQEAIKFGGGKVGEKWKNIINKFDIFKPLKSLSNGAISREKVVAYGKQMLDDSYYEAFLVIVMIWGHGKTGYGPWRVDQMLQTPDCGKKIANLLFLIKKGKLEEAFNSCCRGGENYIKWLGVSFSSKLFYFFGKVYNVKPLPLIFDSLVKKHFCLNKIGYIEYVTEANRWACEKKICPDKIELYAFNQTAE